MAVVGGEVAGVDEAEGEVGECIGGEGAVFGGGLGVGGDEGGFFVGAFWSAECGVRGAESGVGEVGGNGPAKGGDKDAERGVSGGMGGKDEG